MTSVLNTNTSPFEQKLRTIDAGLREFPQLSYELEPANKGGEFTAAIQTQIDAGPDLIQALEEACIVAGYLSPKPVAPGAEQIAGDFPARVDHNTP